MFASINRPDWRGGAVSTGNAMRWIAVLPTIALMACGTDEGAEEGAKAERRYEMVERTGTRGELCATGREVADTYLRLGNEEKYKEWHTTSNIRCSLAELTSPDLPATESESYKQAVVEANAAAEKMDEAARQAAEEFADE